MLNKKADVSDGLLLIIILFFLAISSVIVAFVNDKFHFIVQSTPLNQSDASQTIANSLNNITTTGIQRGYAMIFGMLCIGTLVSSFLVRVHHGFFFLYVLFLGFTIFITPMLANTYNTVVQAQALIDVASQQTMIIFIMQHSVKIMLGVIALSLIVLFAKSTDSGGRI